MRKVFHEELDRVTEGLVEMTRLASSAMSRATTALLDADVQLAESVIGADVEIDALREELDLLSFDLLALQQPVATDLRMVVTSMRMSADIERMGDLARHVAKVARLRYPNSAVPPELRSIILEMGQVAERIVTKAGSVIAARDVEAAKQIERDDDAMDDLHRRLFEALASDSWTHPAETTVDITLVGRYYERFADHAVSVARRVVFLVTGEHGTDSESSHEDDEDHEAHPETTTA
ncbi:phosphate signaling complex protein PhoU [Knoellia sp. S7-12]|uniref:phosphate signaling complex protein PhoU n=1 Tax=Knoellia sp. S7-12 TaxID=3126698 RepID=UPI00336631A3